jgi:hypothetical protein
MDADADANILPLIAPIAAEDAPPRDRLPAVPIVRCLADIDRAVAELLWLDSRETTIVTRDFQQCQLLHSQVDRLLAQLDEIAGRAALQCQLDGVSFADRRRTLLAAVHRFVDQAPRAA